MRALLGLSTTAVLLATCVIGTLSTPAHAADAEAPIALHLENERSKATFEVFRGDLPVGSCTAPCTLVTVRGRVRVRATWKNGQSEEEIDLREDTTVRARRRSGGLLAGGIVLTGLGAASVLVGVFGAVTAGTCWSECPQQSPEQRSAAITETRVYGAIYASIGLGAMVGGIAMIAYSPSALRVVQRGVGTITALRLAVAPTPTGGAMSLSFAF